MPKIIVLVGLPGSGKSTWAARQAVVPLSSDAMRQLLADDEKDQSIHKHVFAALRYLVRQRISIGRPVTYVDATHLTRSQRRPYIKIAESKGCAIEAIFFDIPVEVCIARNQARHRIVPEHVIRAMADKLQPPSKEEGFSRIQVIRYFPTSTIENDPATI